MTRPTLLVLCLGTAFGAPAEFTGQAATGTPAPPVASATVPIDSVGAVASVREWSPIVAIVLRFDRGSLADPAGLEGRARVAAEGAAGALEAALGGPGVSVEVGRGSTIFTVRALPDEWQSALERSVASLAAGPSVDRLSEALARHLERVSFEDGAPLAEFNERFDRLLAGGEVPSARRVDGTFQSVAALDPAALVAQAVFTTPGIAVVGPVDPVSVARSVGRPVATPGGGVVRLDGSQARLAGPTEVPANAPQWSAEARESVVGGVINSWTAAAFPISSAVPRTHLEFVAHILEERLDPYPPADGVFGITAEVRDLTRGPALVLVGTFRPDVGGGWEDEYATRVAELVAAAPPSPFFEGFLKRFRAVSLLAESSPEAEARRLAVELGAGRIPRDLGAELRSLDPAAITSAAGQLGPPRMLRFGPPDGG